MANQQGMQLKMGMQAIGALSDFGIQQTQHKMNVASQEHRNVMNQLSSGIQQNAVTIAEIQTQDSAVRLSEAIQTQSMKDKGSAAVSAAAAGVQGGSVKAAMLGLRRSALQAQDARIRNRDSALTAQAENRKNIELSAIMGKDISVLPAPSAASALLGLGASLVDTWDSNQPTGETSADKMANWFSN
jgi:hypothetical protein